MIPDKRVTGDLLASSKAEGWTTGVNAGEVVVVVGYSDGLVLAAVVVGVTNEGALIVLFDGEL